MKKLERKARDARIAELRKQCQALSNELTALEAKNWRDDQAPWIGRCFKYRNRDSDGHVWWLYYRVIGSTSWNTFRTLKCESQHGGWHIVVTGETLYLLPDPKERGLIPISRREFDAAWKRHVRRIAELNR